MVADPWCVISFPRVNSFCVELFLRQCDEDNVRGVSVLHTNPPHNLTSANATCVQINLVRLYHEYDVDKDGVLSVHVSPALGPLLWPR